MIVRPLVIELGAFELSGYGVLLLAAFVAGTAVIRHELRRRGLSGEFALDVFLAAGIGGLGGAKLWYVVQHGDLAALVDRGGLVWYGGLAGGVAALVATAAWRRVPRCFALELIAPALALGYALGRIGCFLVGDDYGRPTELAWGVRFPEGLPPTTAEALVASFGVELPAGTPPGELLAVHPTQLYEAAIMLAVFALLWRRRNHGHGCGWLFGLYLTLAGGERFLIEFVRLKDDRVLGALTASQLASVLAVATGLLLMRRWAAPGWPELPGRAAVLDAGPPPG